MHGNWIKKSVLLLGMTMTGAAMFAQQATTPPPDTSVQSTAPAAKPQLTPDQKQKLKNIKTTARDQAAVIRHDSTLTEEQKEAKLKELRASTREQMKSVLTPEQQATFANRRAAAKERFAEKLGLTADQQSKMKQVFETAHQQRQTVLDNKSLTNDQKMAQLAQIRQNTKAQMATILTPDQMNKMQQMHKGRGRHAHIG